MEKHVLRRNFCGKGSPGAFERWEVGQSSCDNAKFRQAKYNENQTIHVFWVLKKKIRSRRKIYSIMILI